MNKPTQRFDAVVRSTAGEHARTTTPVSAATVGPAIPPATPSAQNDFVKGPFTRVPATDGVHVQLVAAGAAVAVASAKKA